MQLIAEQHIGSSILFYFQRPSLHPHRQVAPGGARWRQALCLKPEVHDIFTSNQCFNIESLLKSLLFFSFFRQACAYDEAQHDVSKSLCLWFYRWHHSNPCPEPSDPHLHCPSNLSLSSSASCSLHTAVKCCKFSIYSHCSH